MKTELNDYTLYYDGTIGCTEDQLCYFFMHRRDLMDKIFVNAITKDIQSYNDHNNSNIILKVKEISDRDLQALPIDWKIDPMTDEDVASYVASKLSEYLDKHNITDENTEHLLIERVQLELKLFKKIGKQDYLKALIYIVETMQKQKVVWNGRGSAASSFVLFLIGVHRVDSFKYGLPVEEFFKITN